MHKSTPYPEVQERYRLEAERRIQRQQESPQPLANWEHIHARYFALTEGWHAIGDLIVHSIFDKTPIDAALEIVEIPIRRYYNDEGREYFLAPEPTLEQEIFQARVDAITQRIALDDRRRRTVQEIILLRGVLVPLLRQLAQFGVTNILDWALDQRAQYYIERRNLQEKVNDIRQELERLYTSLPEGYAEQFIPVPLEIEITIHARI